MKSWFVHHDGATTLVVIAMFLLGLFGVMALAAGDVIRGFLMCVAAVSLFGLVEDAIRRD
jgi:high-affinity Fe2+/Pb2+ permease